MNPPPPGNVAPPLYGNVVVNGSEIDFISDTCTASAGFGFERFSCALNGNTLVLARAPGPGQFNCACATTPIWSLLAGTYTRVQAPTQGPLPFTPSPAVRPSNWPPGGPVPPELTGAWQPANYNNVLHMIGSVVVNGSEIDFIQDPCGRAGYGYERFSYTLNGDTLVLTRLVGAGQSNCGLLMAGTYSRIR